MQILKGQRWLWADWALVEAVEDSWEFDPEKENIKIRCLRINGFNSIESWSFGKDYKSWAYLKGQDKPKV